MSNKERQRQFRERNPGYYGRLHRKRKARLRATAEATVPAPPVPVVRALPSPEDVGQLTLFDLPGFRREEVVVPATPAGDAAA